MLVVGCSAGVVRAADAPARELAERILKATGTKGGLVVHVGCGDGTLTAGLRASDSYLVHGLDPEAANVAKARAHIRSLGLCGKVTVERWSKPCLPYVDNLVNLLVAEDLGEIPMTEVRRVLVPDGVAYVKNAGTWSKIVKPRPADIDEWTHYLRDASGNAVARDAVVGPPRRFQWIGSPRWSRHHDRMASMSALVSTGGRIFYIFDEGPTSSVQLPPKWFLIARDAFNGTILWKRPIPTWHTHLWPFKSGPAQLPRRLVAVGDRVYVTLGLQAPLTALDAATGQTVRTYERSRATEEVLASQGVLFLLVNDSPSERKPYAPVHRNVGEAKKRVAKEWAWDEKQRCITAVQADSGRILWAKRYKVVPMTLAADGRRVLFHDGERVTCLDRNTGGELWRSEPVARRPSIPTGYSPTLVVYDDVVLFSGGTGSMTAVSAETGETLWSAPHPRSGHNCPMDVLVAGGLVWSGATAGGKDSGVFTGRDLHTGEAKSTFPPDVETYWFHHRCYRAKATERYLLPSRTGIEFIDYRQKHWMPHHWVRGGCIYGIMPCNGLIYAPPHDCACYLESKLYGFCALAPASAGPAGAPRDVAEDGRFEPGPAYNQPITVPTTPSGQDDWSTYRHDTARSGFAEITVPASLTPVWRSELGGRLSGVVTAGGKVYVASIDTHTVYALDAATGKTAWRYTVGGRVDSPPTVDQGRLLFGSADGWVYCLCAADGVLIWRYRAAPADRRMTAFEQVESVWPVHGSVLVRDGVAYCVAGRSMFLDGGMRLLRLDVKRGRKLSETVLDDRDPQTGADLQASVKVLNMPVALPDVLSSDGRHVYMRSQQLELDGTRRQATPVPTDPAALAADQAGEGVHLFCPGGLLDDSWFHRSYWVFGRNFSSGCNWYFQAGRHAPAGRILTFDASSVYGYGRKVQYYQWTTPIEYHLWATSKEIPRVEAPARKPGASQIRVAKSKSLDPTGKPLTVSAWVKPEAKDGVILARGGDSHGYALLVRGGKPRFAVRVERKAASVGAGEGVVGKWVHLVGVLTADKKLEIYVNGKRGGTAQAPGLMVTNPHQAMEIGADDGSTVGDYKSPFGFTGIVDEVRIYHRALGADEIERHYSMRGRPAAPEAGLVLYYSFDKGDATDDSGQGNDGAVTGAERTQGRLGDALRLSNRRDRGVRTALKYRWTRPVPLHVRAMVLTKGALFIAGPPDVLDEEEVFARPEDAGLCEKLVEQSAALAGQRGALLCAVSAEDGKELARHALEAPPVFDGMAAARGRLYVALESGQLVCMGGG